MPPRPRRSESKPVLSPVRRRSQKRAGGPWNYGPIPVIGVVGGMGAGKSTVSGLLEARGAHVIDADHVGHALLDQKPSRLEVVARFGPEVLSSEDPERADRAALARRVFADPAERAALERILHPRMKSTFEKAIARAVRRGEARMVVLDAAVLFEAGWNEICDFVVFVDAPFAVRLDRLRAHRSWTAADLKAREAAQWPLERKRGLADMVVVNDGDRDRLAPAIAEIGRRIRLTRGDWFRARSRSEPPVPGARPAQDASGPRANAAPPAPEETGRRPSRKRSPSAPPGRRRPTRSEDS
jgi:dephospho-CoA kinase